MGGPRGPTTRAHACINIYTWTPSKIRETASSSPRKSASIFTFFHRILFVSGGKKGATRGLCLYNYSANRAAFTLNI